MKVQERSYSGKTFRPKPQIAIDEANGILVVSTAWGLPEVALKTNQLIIDMLKNDLDEEATKFGIPQDALSDSTYRLRSAMTAANDLILQTENKSSYQVVVESAAIFCKGNSLYWAQVGGPNILLGHPKGLQPLANELDWAWQIFEGSPMVTYGLGLEKSCQIHVGTVHLRPGSFLTLLERSYIPPKFFTENIPNLTSMSQSLIEEGSEVPFWLGLVTF